MSRLTPIYDTHEELLALIDSETKKRRADLRPLHEGEVVEAMILGLGMDHWICIVRGPLKALLDKYELPPEGEESAFPGGTFPARVAEIADDVIYLTRVRG